MEKLKQIQISNQDGSISTGYTFEKEHPKAKSHSWRMWLAAGLWGGGIGANIALTSDNLAGSIIQTAKHMAPEISNMLQPASYINTFLDARMPFLCTGALLTYLGIHGSLLNPSTWKRVSARFNSEYKNQILNGKDNLKS